MIMGKTSKSRLSGGSNHSLNSGSSKHKITATMSSQKLQNRKKKNHNKTKKNIKKLFEVLRNESNTTIESLDNSVIVVDNTLTPCRKRKLPEPNLNLTSKRRNNSSLIVINDTDDNEVITTTSPSTITPKKPSPLNCSTPLNKDSNKLLMKLSSVTEQDFKEEVTDLTRQINRDSYVTIDLTTDTLNCSNISKTQNTVIDLANTTDNNNDCTFVTSVSNASLSMSGDSDVTVLSKSPRNKTTQKQMQKVFNGISKLNPTEKSKMLEYVVKQILNGCDVPESVKTISHNVRESTNRATETVEDTYIKEVILGQSNSRNSIGSNIYNPECKANRTGLRMVVIDGSNVAMAHGMGHTFSVQGLKTCIDYFLKRGHVVKAFVPRFRCKYGKSTAPRLLDDLERRGLVVYTPSREIQGRLVTSYDDRYIVQCAAEFDGVIVSGDNYRDLLNENPRWRFVIENRLLPFTWVNNMIMFPRDPLGRYGPTLEQFLRHPSNTSVNKN